MSKQDLKLIKSPEPLKPVNNFWRVCPRVLEFLPEQECAKGKPEIDTKSNRVQEDPECPWWINSKDHNYCFWKYIHDKSSPDGVMQELVQSELAQLFGWSNTKTHFVLKEAMEELTEKLKEHDAFEMLKELAEESSSDFNENSGFDSDDSYE